MTQRQALKLVRGMTPEQFADFCFPTAGTVDQRREFFDAIKWREGYTYCCQSWEYARQTGYKCIQTLLERDAHHRATYPS